MFECRKIYGNLLLLSLILFSLGASVRPLNCELAGGECVWSAPGNCQDLQWDNRSATVIYRGQQLAALFGNEAACLLPEELDELRNYDCWTAGWAENWRFSAAAEYTLPISRAPPVKKLPVW